ncbi:MAG: YfhO family protein [Ruminococcus callidus]
MQSPSTASRNKLTDPQWKYQNQNNNFQYTISSDEPIQKLKLKFSAGDYVISQSAMYTMQYDTLHHAAEQLSPWELRHDNLGDDTMEGDIQVKEDGWFVLAVPYDTGFHVTIDGKDTAYYRTDKDFLGCPISAGSHSIRITYAAPLAKQGRWCSAAGSALQYCCSWATACSGITDRKTQQLIKQIIYHANRIFRGSGNAVFYRLISRLSVRLRR